MHEITQQLNIHVVEAPTSPGTGSGVNATQLGDFIAQNSNLFLVVAIAALLILAFFMFRRHSVRIATKVRLGLATVVVLLLSIIAVRLVAPANADSVSLGRDTVDITIVQPALSATVSDTIFIPGSFPTHDFTAAIDSISDSRITIELNGETLSSSPTTITSDSIDTSHTLDYVVSITGDLPVGIYTASIAHSIIDKVDNSESFMFTIDTRMTDTLDTDPTHYDGTATTFYVPTSGYAGVSVDYWDPTDSPYDWIINWGDGSALQAAAGISSVYDEGIMHDYATPGEYQITISSNGEATAGWLDAFGFYFDPWNGTVTNTLDNKLMFKSIDSQLTNLMRTLGGGSYAYMFYEARNAVEIPANLFALIDFTGVDDMTCMFYGTFGFYAYNSTAATIPSGLFDSMSSAAPNNTEGLFDLTFNYYAYNSTAATIPSDLFALVDTSLVTHMPQMFYCTFNYYAFNSTVATIPSGLFDTIDTRSAINLMSLYSGTFQVYAYNSPVADIPANLFDSVDTTSAQDMSFMFDNTFSSYAYNSPVADIPANLFDSVDTSNATNVSGIFAYTFDTYAYSSTTAAIPANLFTAIDLSSASNVSNLFACTFYTFAYMNTTPTTDINTIWGSANFAGKITSANVATTTWVCTGTFSATFYNMRSLTGTAQTFISGKLSGITPALSAMTFRNTQVTDYATIGGNWR